MGFIAIDLDGTLINNNHVISKENIKAIQKAQEFGYEVVIATGRAHFDVQRILNEVNLSLYTIGANGSTAHSPSGTNILSISMSEAKAKEIVTWLDKENFYYELFCNDGIYTLKDARKILYEEIENAKETAPDAQIAFMELQLEKQISQSGYVFIENIQEIFAGNNKIYNILAYSFNDKKRQSGWEKFKDEKDLTLVASSPFNFELEHPNASKGKAIVYLAKVLNENLSRSMAVGDSGNDISMFEVVTESFAMDNANDEVKSKAKHITASNDEDGVAKAIYSFLGVEKTINKKDYCNEISTNRRL